MSTEVKSGYSTVKIKNSWKVLEIGGGANPCERANVITNYKQEENQRAKKAKVVPGAKMLEMDVQDMSDFKDKEFDFSLCVQVLEHVDNPVKACKEIMRVSKQGYIETPSPLCEKTIGWPFHKWLVYICPKNPNKLIFVKKSEEDYKRQDDFFWNMFYKQRNKEFIRVLLKYYKQWITVFHWKGEFEVEVIR
jgi:ubiquinone/menaquinone biosynthesis C-methylase UbiE